MLIRGSRVNVTDTTGALIAEIFGIYKGKKTVRMNDIVRVAVKDHKSTSKLERKKPMKALIVRLRHKTRVSGMFHQRFMQNAAIILGEDDKPLSSRGLGVTSSRVRRQVANNFDEVL